MNKISISLILLSLTLLLSPLAANSDALYSIDENGNWVYKPAPVQTTTPSTTQQRQTTQTYNNTNSYSYGNTNTSNTYNTTNTYNTNSYNTTNRYTSNPMNNEDMPYSIQVTKTKQPFNTNLSLVDLNTMVNKIGDNIVYKNHIGKNVKFIVNSNNVINATTGITNNITVYKGLIEYCENEDELAFVIGHELGHATKSHVLKTYGVNVTTGIAGELAKMKLAERIGNKWGRLAATTAVDQTTEAVQNKISREQEKDADQISIDYVVAAGYNPLAGISIMNKIGSNYADFWSDHPSTDKRVISMYRYIKQNYPQYLEQGFDTYSYKQALTNYVR